MASEIRLARNEPLLSVQKCMNVAATKSGALNLEGFATIYPLVFPNEGRKLTSTIIEKHFQFIDTDSDGIVSWTDLVVFLCTTNPQEYVPRVVSKVLEKEYKKLDSKNRGWVSKRQYDSVFRGTDWGTVPTDKGALEKEEQEWEVIQEKKGQPTPKVSQAEFMRAGYALFARLEYTDRDDADDLDSMMASYMMSIADSDLCHHSTEESPSNKPPPSPKTPMTPMPSDHKQRRFQFETKDQPAVTADKSTETDKATLKPLSPTSQSSEPGALKSSAAATETKKKDDQQLPAAVTSDLSASTVLVSPAIAPAKKLSSADPATATETKSDSAATATATTTAAKDNNTSTVNTTTAASKKEESPIATRPRKGTRFAFSSKKKQQQGREATVTTAEGQQRAEGAGAAAAVNQDENEKVAACGGCCIL